MNKNTVADDIISGLEDFVAALQSDGPICETFTCRKIVLDLHPQKYGPDAVKSVRKLLRVSQVLFAQFLGVSPKTVRAWEQGKVAPGDMACRFLDEIKRNPDYWRKRLAESVIVKEGAT